MIIAAGLVVALGALVQGTVGYGMALVAAPLLALIEPALVPVPLILLTSAHAVLVAVRDWRHADWKGIGWAMLGRLPGTGLGVLAVVALSERVFTLLVGL
ncbi:MAG TPA: TSUP family transporter, partial [Pseudonocardiaceae bacterium]|nr:TSUP family transporter [Pseudonocardiaceae bacterium]